MLNDNDDVSDSIIINFDGCGNLSLNLEDSLSANPNLIVQIDVDEIGGGSNLDSWDVANSALVTTGNRAIRILALVPATSEGASNTVTVTRLANLGAGIQWLLVFDIDVT